MNSESWNRLFSQEELIAANERYEAQQFAERQRKLAEIQADYQREEAERTRISQEKPFVYQARAPELWAARANQPIHRRWERVHGHYVLTQQERERLAAKVQALLELARGRQAEITVSELSQITGMSEGWVRKHLRQNGIRLVSQRQKRKNP